MKIGFSVKPIIGEKAGVGCYTYNLIQSILDLETKDRFIFFANLFRNSWRRYKQLKHLTKILDRGSNRSSLKVAIIPDRIFDLLSKLNIFFLEALVGTFDIYHSTDYSAPDLKRAKLISTIHDVSVLDCPQWHTSKSRIRHTQLLKDLIKKSDFIIAVSEFTKVRIIHHFGNLEKKLTVIHNGLNGSLLLPIEGNLSKMFLKRYDLRPGYLLYVGTLEPRKNLVRLIRAYDYLYKKGKVRNDLILVGKLGWLYDEILDTWNNSYSKEHIRLTGYVSENKLTLFYKHAGALIYPSFYEGFGLPVLEAMAMGLPVVCSKIPVFEEVANEAAIFFDPQDDEDMGNAILNVLHDTQLREKLIKYGRIRADIFRWQEKAKKIYEIYKQLLAK